MQLFLDTSKIEQIRTWKSVIGGVTTNPSILMKEGGSLDDICEEMGDLPVSIQVSGDLYANAKFFSGKYSNAVIKVSLLTVDGKNNLALIERLITEGVKVNCTALMSPAQVLLAVQLGVTYVSLFVGRIYDEGGNNSQLEMAVDAIRSIEEESDPHRRVPKLIFGSLRQVSHVLVAQSCGAHIATVPPTVMEKMVMHHYSLETVRQFEADSKEVLSV